MRSHSVLVTLKGHTGSVSSVAFSPDGKSLASASDDNTVILWDAERHKALITLKGHKESVTSVAFSPDGKLLASGSYDKTVILWDVASSGALATLNGDGSGVLSLAFSPDSKALISGTLGKILIQWNLDPSSLSRQSCRTANRNLSCEEWHQYIGTDTPYQKTCPALPGPELCQ